MDEQSKTPSNRPLPDLNRNRACAYLLSKCGSKSAEQLHIASHFHDLLSFLLLSRDDYVHSQLRHHRSRNDSRHDGSLDGLRLHHQARLHRLRQFVLLHSDWNVNANGSFHVYVLRSLVAPRYLCNLGRCVRPLFDLRHIADSGWALALSQFR